MKWKLNNVMSLTAARWAAAEGIDYISFNFDPMHEAYISPLKVEEICKWVKGIKTVGFFNNTEPALVIDYFATLQLEFIELGLEMAERTLPIKSVPTILHLKEKSLKEALGFAKYYDCIAMFCIEEECLDLKEVPFHKTFVNSGLDPDHINPKPFGITLNSGIETAPGMMNFEALESHISKWSNT